MRVTHRLWERTKINAERFVAAQRLAFSLVSFSLSLLRFYTLLLWRSRDRPRFVPDDDDGDDVVSCVYTRTTHRWFVE